MDGSGWVEAQTVRGARGRFAPGVSGNPAGKRKGTLNQATMLAAAFRIDESGAIARVVIDRALAGDMVAARFCIGLLLPKPRDRPVELDLPEGNGLDDIVASFAVTVAAMAAGEITPEEALTVSKVLNHRRRAIEARARQQQRETRRCRGTAQPCADLHSACNSSSRGNEVPAAASSHRSSASPVAAAETIGFRRSGFIETAIGPSEISAEPADAETPPAPPAAPAPDPVAADLHFACSFSSRGNQVPAAASGFIKTATGLSETLAEPGETAEATDAPPRRPLPRFGSACIRPAIRARTSRSVA